MVTLCIKVVTSVCPGCQLMSVKILQTETIKYCFPEHDLKLVDNYQWQCCRLGDRGIVVRFLAGEEILPFRKKKKIRPALAPAPAANPWDPQRFLRVGAKRPEREADHLSLIPCKRMSGVLPPIQYMPSWRAQLCFTSLTANYFNC